MNQKKKKQPFTKLKHLKKNGECPRPTKSPPEKKEISDVFFFLSQAICWCFFSVKEQHVGGKNKIWMFPASEKTHECDI